MRRLWPIRQGMLLAAAALLVFASRILFISNTIEDIDTINFSLAIADFNPLKQQPHPPGYPVVVALGKVLSLVVPDAIHALGLLSALSQAVLVVPLFFLFRDLTSSKQCAAWATVLTLANPTVWFNGVRPLSDSLGFLCVVVTQLLLLTALSDSKRWSFLLASFLVGLGPGVRPQVLILTGPLWLLVAWRKRRDLVLAVALAGLAATLWIVPVLVACGGAEPFRRAYVYLLQENAASETLLARFTVNAAARRVLHAFFVPWDSLMLGAVIIALSLAGVLRVLRRRASSLAVAMLMFAPYVVWHLFFQLTTHVRYTLPYMPSCVWLAMEGIAFVTSPLAHDRLRRWLRPALALVLVVVCVPLVLPALSAYHASIAPPVLAVRTASDLAAQSRGEAVLAGNYTFKRYVELIAPAVDVLQVQPMGEALEVARYFRDGGKARVLYVREPYRTDMESFDPRSQQVLGEWSWPEALEHHLRGSRPYRAQLVRLDSPLWFVMEGWHLTDEWGEPQELLRRNDRRAYLRPLAQESFLLVAGQPFDQAAAGSTLEMSVDNEPLLAASCEAPLLQGLILRAVETRSGYRELVVRTSRDGRPSGTPFFLRGLDYAPVTVPGAAHGDGWFNPERDESFIPFRWLSRQARSVLYLPPGGARLSIKGLVPYRLDGDGVHLTVEVDGQSLEQRRLHGSFQLDLSMPAQERAFRILTLRSDRSFVPHHYQLNGDRRQLSLRIYGFQLHPMDPSTPG